jgi:DNA replication protein DnaC
MNPIDEMRERLRKADEELKQRLTAKYTCLICGKTNLSYEVVQNWAYFLDNEGEPSRHSSLSKKMFVCGEPCREKFVTSGRVPYMFLMEGVGIPPRFQKHRITDWGQITIDLIAGWFHNKPKGQGLYLQGPPGTGKTSIVSALAYEFRKREETVQFTTANDIVITANAEQYKPEQFLKRYSTKEYLIVDDLAKHGLTATAKELVFKLFANAYNEEKTIIITSNYVYKELAENIDERLSSRLEEMCMMLPFTGTDKRKNAGK